MNSWVWMKSFLGCLNFIVSLYLIDRKRGRARNNSLTFFLCGPALVAHAVVDGLNLWNSSDFEDQSFTRVRTKAVFHVYPLKLISLITKEWKCNRGLCACIPEMLCVWGSILTRAQLTPHSEKGLEATTSRARSPHHAALRAQEATRTSAVEECLNPFFKGGEVTALLVDFLKPNIDGIWWIV